VDGNVEDVVGDTDDTSDGFVDSIVGLSMI